MAKRKELRKTLVVIFTVIFLIIILNYCMGVFFNPIIRSIISSMFCIGTSTMCIIGIIFLKKQNNHAYGMFEEHYKKLEGLYEERDKLYSIGSKEEIEECSIRIENTRKVLISFGECLLAKAISKERKNRIKKIIKKC